MTYRGEDDLAEKARKVKVGKSYEVRGVIQQFEFSNQSTKKASYDAVIDLIRIEFEPLK